MGLAFALAEVVGFSGPLHVGALDHATGSYLAGLAVLAGGTAVVVLAGLILDAVSWTAPNGPWIDESVLRPGPDAGGMDKVAIDDVPTEINPMEVHDVRKPVSKVLGTEYFAMNYFELAPGDSFSGGLHTHHDQEEVFYVESGTAEFEAGREREIITVEAGELIRFEPGEFQTGGVPEDADEEVVGWALGAPGARHDREEIESIVYCRECDDERRHETVMTDEGRFHFTCGECGNEFTV
jgi:quercetin dioxygenase-like cupin family protein